MQPPGQGQKVVADGGMGQGVGDDRLDVLLAGRTGVAMDRMLGDLGPQVLEDVLDGPRALPPATLKRPAAVGADLRAVFLSPVDLRRRRPATAEMPRLGAGPALAPRRGRLDVHGLLPRWRRGTFRAGQRQLALQWGDGGVLLGNPPGRQQEGQLGHARPPSGKFFRLRLGQPPANGRLNQGPDKSFPARGLLHTLGLSNSRAEPRPSRQNPCKRVKCYEEGMRLGSFR
jgi:hypothetical protein